jgi:hypothetical protein
MEIITLATAHLYTRIYPLSSTVAITVLRNRRREWDTGESERNMEQGRMKPGGQRQRERESGGGGTYE